MDHVSCQINSIETWNASLSSFQLRVEVKRYKNLNSLSDYWPCWANIRRRIEYGKGWRGCVTIPPPLSQSYMTHCHGSLPSQGCTLVETKMEMLSSRSHYTHWFALNIFIRILHFFSSLIVYCENILRWWKVRGLQYNEHSWIYYSLWLSYDLDT